MNSFPIAVDAMQTVVGKKPGRIEARLSLAVLVILMIVAGSVWLRQFKLNPAVVALQPEAQTKGLSSGDAQMPVIDIPGSDISPFSRPEHFTPETLYEKIDGRADLYLASGFVSLATQRFLPGGGTDSWVEVFIYDMATPANAFSVFSMQRRQDGQPDDIAPNAYRTGNALFLVQGKYYLELIGTDASATLQRTMNALARRFIDQHGGAAIARTPGDGLFPTAGIVAGTMQLISTNAFGYAELDRIYTARYLIDGTPLTAFVSDRQTAAAASALAQTYDRLLVTYGAAPVDMSIPIADATALKLFDTYEIIVARGAYFAGVHEATDLTVAERLAAQLAEHLTRMAKAK